MHLRLAVSIQAYIKERLSPSRQDARKAAKRLNQQLDQKLVKVPALRLATTGNVLKVQLIPSVTEQKDAVVPHCIRLYRYLTTAAPAKRAIVLVPLKLRIITYFEK